MEIGKFIKNIVYNKKGKGTNELINNYALNDRTIYIIDYISSGWHVT